MLHLILQLGGPNVYNMVMRDLADVRSVCNQRWLIYLAAFAICTTCQSARSISATPNSGATGPDQLPDVMVIAPRPPTPGELAGKAVPDFVHVHAAPAIVTEQLARWRIGICPMTSGLSDSFNDFVTARILAVATSVGAPIQAPDHCKPNGKHDVFIFFSIEPKKTLDELVKQDSRILGFHYVAQTRTVERITRPIQGWYVTATRGANGDIAIDLAQPLLPLASDAMHAGKHPAGLPGSRLTSQMTAEIYNVVIVVDTKAILGRPIGSIADYLAVLTLTMALAPERCGTLPSILDVLLPDCGGGEKPTSITAGDLSFLRALYKSDLDAVLPLERGDIGNSMMRQFENHE
jgi:hypothetical protein